MEIAIHGVVVKLRTTVYLRPLSRPLRLYISRLGLASDIAAARFVM
jgi:hypothetical protein